MWNVRKNGVILSSTFMKLGVIVPSALAVLWFGEKPGWNQGVGLLIAVVAILLINLEKGAVRTGGSSKAGLVLLLLGGGLGDAMAKFYDAYGKASFGSFFLMLSFLVRGDQRDTCDPKQRADYKKRSSIWSSHRNPKLFFGPVSALGAGRCPCSHRLSDLQHCSDGSDRSSRSAPFQRETYEKAVGSVWNDNPCCGTSEYVERHKKDTESVLTNVCGSAKLVNVDISTRNK